MARLKAINHSDMRSRSVAIVVNHLYQHASISRASIAKTTGLNKATVTSIIRVLIENGFVVEAGTKVPAVSAGKPAIDLKINPDAGRVIGAEINGETIQVAVLDVTPNIIWRRVEPYPAGATSEAVIAQLVRLLREACDTYKSEPAPILGIMVGLSGFLDLKKNIVLHAPDLGWRDVPIGKMIQKEITLPVAIGNMGRVAALGEDYFGTSATIGVSVYLNLGMVINSGVLVSRHTLDDATAFGCEAGHMTIIPGGEPCSCGNRGCWNTVASQAALLTRVRARLQAGHPSQIAEMTGGDLTRITLRTILQAAREKDEVAVWALGQISSWLGLGIANLINLLSPEFVILGGPMSAAYDLLLPGIQHEIAHRSFVDRTNNSRILPAKYRDDASLVGSLAVIYWNLMNKLQNITLPADGTHALNTPF